MTQRFVGHHRTQVRAADPDVDHGADGPARVARPGTATHAVGERRHPIEDRVHLRRRRRRRRRPGEAARGIRSAVCRAGRSSETLTWSPRNIASIRSRRPHSSARAISSRIVSVRDAMLRVVEVEACALGHQPLPAARVLGEEVAQVPVADLGVVCGRARHDSRSTVAPASSRRAAVDAQHRRGPRFETLIRDRGPAAIADAVGALGELRQRALDVARASSIGHRPGPRARSARSPRSCPRRRACRTRSSPQGRGTQR